MSKKVESTICQQGCNDLLETGCIHKGHHILEHKVDLYENGCPHRLDKLPALECVNCHSICDDMMNMCVEE